jgi:hypothetical protein
MTKSSAIPFPLQEIVAGAIARTGRTGWRMRNDDFWCHVAAPAPMQQVQGWKLHVSATPLSAPLVLHSAAQVLLEAGCHFKFARNLDLVQSSTWVGYNRAQAGKFITAYPADEDEFHRLAIQLCDVTVGMPGPRILSDRPYRPDSIVQYRFGAFKGVSVLTNDGTFEARLQTPTGDLVTDHRRPWFSPPPWVNPMTPRDAAPIRETVPAPVNGTSSSKPVLADGRFEVLRALRHSARGGVYQAFDTKTGYPVLIKAARAHIGADRRGEDSRALLAYEAKVLAELSPLTPSVVCMFDTADHTFLAEDFVEGQSLTHHIAATVRHADLSQQRELALALVKLVQGVHQRGWVLRDLSSNNIILTPGRQLVLVDVEHAVREHDVVSRIYTPGFAAPEILGSPEFGYAPGPEADAFALGSILIHLLLASPPAFLKHEGGGGPTLSARIARLLDLARAERPLIREWWPLLTGLCESDPASRWGLNQAAEFLRAEQVPRSKTTVMPPSASPLSPQAEDEPQRVIQDGIQHLLSTMAPDAERLWAADGFGATTDPLNVQYGAAGVLAVLARAGSHGHPEAAEALPLVADWMRQRLDQAPRILPGLYFGRAGTAWALREAADLLGDTDLTTHVEGFAHQLPTRWPNPDICHGVAGAGLTHLRMWQLSGRRAFLDPARACAESLLAAAHHVEDGAFWPVPADFDSTLAGRWHLGFGHGVAGVGAFLLAIGQACGDPRYLELANAAGRTLVAAADVDERTGAATWRTERERQPNRTDMLFHWCSGASGIATFLVRLAAVQPDEAAAQPYRDLVHSAAIAVHQARWLSPTAACHGLAGNGQFLLDALADAEQAVSPHAAAYRDWAEDLAQVIVARHAVHNGLMVIPDESGQRVTAGYGTGLAGVLDFLLRLRNGGSRSWMVELP